MKRWLALWLVIAACHERRVAEDAAPTYAELRPVLQRACARCHDAKTRAGGYALDDYLSAIGCTADGRVATAEGDAAPILRVLSRADHSGLLDRAALARLGAWVKAGAPAFRGTVHEPGVIDPRSPAWHGSWLARDGFRLLRDASAPEACGRCHEGTPVRLAEFVTPAPDAPACTSCHDQPGGVLACSTCHGVGTRAYPPRDACYFGGEPADAHASHATTMRFTKGPLACTTCHPVPGDELFAGKHANGSIDVDLGPRGSFDAEEDSCSVGCHAQGGTEVRPSWQKDLTVDCQSCHLSPPVEHYPGRCDSCHVDMGETADSLAPGHLHLDGKVDLGDGSGTCAACHGRTPGGEPADAGHARHLGSVLTDTPGCEVCHAASTPPPADAHMNGRNDVVFSGVAGARGQVPEWLAGEQRCAATACHGAGLATSPHAPRWSDALRPATCDGCHGAPPAPPHVQTASCGGGLCHGNEVGLAGEALVITPEGRHRHIDGVLSIGP